MDITLYNTRTRRKERLAPVTPGRASMYVCGPTVYDRAHIGNARAVVAFDVLFRLLRHTYGAENVAYVRNITDVEDKINARAKAAGRPIGEITAETTRWYHEDMDALGALRPTFEPRATEYIGEMVAMIALLVERGHAYVAEGHVLFAVASYPEYGRLARRSLEDMRAGARVEVAPYKRDPMDFVLWKPSDPETPGWDSPWGRGRPGWHIECSAMARALLGAEFDIHGGGVDLAFPHHENELAQSVCAHPDEGFARVWMHNGMLNVEGEKMSKSLGNFFTVRDLLDRGVPGEVIRFVLLSTHYRQPMGWTERRVAEAQRTLEEWFFFLHQAGYSPEMVTLLRSQSRFSPDVEFMQFMRNDMNTPGAMARLHHLARPGGASQLSAFAASLELLGYIDDWSILADLARLGVSRVGEYEPWVTELVDHLLSERSAARAKKDFERADRIRAGLVAAGVVVEDTGGVSGWSAGPKLDLTKLQALR